MPTIMSYLWTKLVQLRQSYPWKYSIHGYCLSILNKNILKTHLTPKGYISEDFLISESSQISNFHFKKIEKSPEEASNFFWIFLLVFIALSSLESLLPPFFSSLLAIILDS